MMFFVIIFGILEWYNLKPLEENIGGKLMKRFTAILIVMIIALTTISVYAEPPQLGAPSAILIDSKSGRVLYEKNADVRHYPASTTKVMTGFLAAEYGKLDEQVTASPNVVNIERGSSQIYIQPGEVLTMQQLLYSLMLESANDAAIDIAEHIGGSIDNFAKIMNEKAKSLGATNTNFVNPNGLHNDNHYTTARDLALIARGAMQNPLFRQVVSTYHYEIPATNKQDARPYITNGNKLISPYSKYKYQYAIGIKTGYTTKSQHVLVGAAQKDGMELISVVMDDNKDDMYPDTIAMFDYGFANFKSLDLLKNNAIVTTISVDNGDKKLNLLASEDYSFIGTPEEVAGIEKTKAIKLNEGLKAPINKGDVVGVVSYTIDGKTHSVNLIAEEGIQSTRIVDKVVKGSKHVKWWQILLFIVVLFLIWRTFVAILRSRRRSRSMFLTRRRRYY